jgi:hypothetical protein
VVDPDEPCLHGSTVAKRLFLPSGTCKAGSVKTRRGCP